MNGKIRLIVLILICLMLMTLFVGCNSTTNTPSSSKANKMNYYSKEDFQSLTIGVSNFEDLDNIASPESIQVTSYGACCNYLMQNGGYVRIKLYGKDLIVGAIEEVLCETKETPTS